jgi:carboxylesterase type B
MIVFIPGGGYQVGESNDIAVYGQHFAMSGRAIFVSINYRLNIWGFPSTTPIKEMDQNVGISDARLAVKWIANNIAHFGGDPARIIITGHSAGAHLVDAHMYAYAKDPIAIGQISASGAIGMIYTAPADGIFWNNISGILGCGDATTATQVSLIPSAK